MVQAIVFHGVTPTQPAYAVAVKQLYASHYFETALDLTVCVRGTDSPGPHGFYLITIKGSQQAGLTGLKGGIVRHVAVDKTRSSLERALASTLSPATVRQRESYLKKHILPKFKDAGPHTLDIGTLQQFATELRKSLSRKTIINVLGAIFSILDYAGRTGTRVAKVGFADIRFGSESSNPPTAFFTRDQATQIVQEAEEP